MLVLQACSGCAASIQVYVLMCGLHLHQVKGALHELP